MLLLAIAIVISLILTGVVMAAIRMGDTSAYRDMQIAKLEEMLRR